MRPPESRRQLEPLLRLVELLADIAASDTNERSKATDKTAYNEPMPQGAISGVGEDVDLRAF